MSSSSDKQGKTELNISSHQNKDKDSKDYAMHDAGKENKHEKTTITFERKKQCDDKSCQEKTHEHGWNKDKDLSKDKELHFESKDVNKDNKDWNKDLNKDKDMHDKSESKGGIINTIKEKVKDVLSSGDSDKSKDKEKDVHISSSDYNKKDKDINMSGADYTKKDKDIHMSGGADYNKNKDVDRFATVGVASAQPATLGASSGSSAYHTSNLGASGSSNLGASGSSNLGSSNLSSDKQFSSAGAGTGYGAGQVTVDHKNLGAEHREVGYDKQSAVIPSKEKEKDTVHKVDVHGSLYTSGAGSTFKTNEAK